MNQLLEFLNVLSQEEVNKLRNATFRGNEGKLLDHMLSFRQSGVSVPDGDLLLLPGVSKTYYYKLVSTTLRKSYEVLVPEGGIALIRWLNRRSLNDHAFHELRLQEKDLSEAGKTEDLIGFLKECLQIFQRNSRHRQHVKIPEYLAGQLQYIQPDNSYIRQFCSIQLFMSHVWTCAARGQAKAERDSLATEFETLQQALVASDFAELQLEFYKAAGTYHILIWDDNIASLKAITKALDLANSLGISDAERYAIEAKLAEMHYFTSGFQAAYNSYISLFNLYPEIAAQDLYHQSKFFQVCLILNRNSIVHERIGPIFGDHVRGVNPNTVVMGCLNYLKLYLSEDNTEAARFYLVLGREMLDKNSFFQYDTELRFLEEYYFFLKQDMETCQNLIKRDLKFLRQKNRLPGNSELPWFPMLLLEIMAIRTGIKKILRPRFRPHFAAYQESSYGVYGLLLKNALQGTEKNLTNFAPGRLPLP